MEKEKEPQPSTSGGQSSRSALEIDTSIRNDGFGGHLGQDIGIFKYELFFQNCLHWGRCRMK